jgi:hypothetical protein
VRASPYALAAAFLAALLATSCVAFQRWQKHRTQKLREIELEDVAKSWCQTIRASQVIPVYPLTEDLQPGDVFLVRTTVEDQHEEYTRRGFLPFDQHLKRLNPEGYGAFYGHSILPGDDDDARLPGDWMRPGGALPETGTAWAVAPRAAFPSSSFSVKAGGGFNLALPVQGVPVGLSLLASQSASGTISLRDAKTLGIDALSVWADLQAWAQARRGELSDYAAQPGHPAYLRIVTRVYLIGAIDVALSSTSSGGLGLDVGAPKKVEAPGTEPPAEGGAEKTAADRYAETLQKVNDSLQSSEPGGSLRVTSIGAGTVSLHETFDPPLVLGYLGFDCEILPGGALANPIPTRIALEDPALLKRLAAASPVAAVYAGSLVADSYALLQAAVENEGLPRDLHDSGEAVIELLDALGRYVPEGALVYRRDPTSDGYVLVSSALRLPQDATGYQRFTRYRGSLKQARTALGNALALDSFRFKDESGGSHEIDVEAGGPELERLRHDEAELRARLDDPPWERDEERAVRAAYQWLSRFGAAASRP